jgi:hypothetical protein
MTTSLSFCSQKIYPQKSELKDSKSEEEYITPFEPINNGSRESTSICLEMSHQKEKILNYSKKNSHKFHNLCEDCQDKLNATIYDSILSRKRLKKETVINLMLASEIHIHSQLGSESSNKRTRKMDRDCIHKKIKCRVFKHIKSKMKELMQDKYSYLRIPQNVICDATYKYNHWLLNTTIMNIFVEKDLYFSNLDNISSFAKKGKENSLIEFLNSKVSDVFKNYLNSESYLKDLQKFQNTEYLKIFKTYCDGFIDYYNKPN